MHGGKHKSQNTLRLSHFNKMKKDAYYFPHYSNARNDRKIMKLRRILGLEGYAIYFMLLETLRDQTDFKFPIASIPELEFEFRTSKEKIMSVVNDFDLFTIDGNVFYSIQQVAYLQPYLQRTEQARLAAVTRWNKAKSMQKQCVSIANDYAKRGEERKGEKKREEKKIGEKRKIVMPFHSEKFHEKWELWKEYRKEAHNFSYKSIISEQAAIMKLVKLADGLETVAIDIIVQSIAEKWKGFYKLQIDTENDQDNQTQRIAEKFSSQD